MALRLLLYGGLTYVMAQPSNDWLGTVLGFLSGLFGVGGSSVATPLLRLLGVSRLIALATPLPVTLPMALVGGLTSWRRGLVNQRAALWTAAGGVPSVVIGSLLTTVVPGRILMALTGAFIVLVGLRLLRQPLSPQDGTNSSNEQASVSIVADSAKHIAGTVASPRSLLIVGAGIGFLSGLLANGGGFLLVPAYLLLFNLTAQEAAATSLVAVALLALPSTVVHWRLHHIDPMLATLLAIGGIPATYLGARVGLALRSRDAQRLFGLFLLAFGLFFLARTLYRGEVYGWMN